MISFPLLKMESLSIISNALPKSIFESVWPYVTVGLFNWLTDISPSPFIFYYLPDFKASLLELFSNIEFWFKLAKSNLLVWAVAVSRWFSSSLVMFGWTYMASGDGWVTSRADYLLCLSWREFFESPCWLFCNIYYLEL